MIFDAYVASGDMALRDLNQTVQDEIFRFCLNGFDSLVRDRHYSYSNLAMYTERIRVRVILHKTSSFEP